MDANITELVILRMGILLSPPIPVSRHIQEFRIPLSPPRLLSWDTSQSEGVAQHVAYFKQSSPEYILIGDHHYRVLDYLPERSADQ